MFHIPAHHAVAHPAAQYVPADSEVECPACGGFGDHGIEEESGCRYSCYRCGMSGLVSLDSAFEEYAASAAYDAERDLGYNPGDEERDLRYAESGEAGHASDDFDDIPF